MNKFLLKSAVLAIIVFGISRFVLGKMLGFEVGLGQNLLLLGIFWGLTLGIQYMLLKSVNKRAQQFINTFMGATGIKLFFLIIVLMIFLASSPGLDKKAFILHYFLFYICFSVLEIRELLSTLRRLQ